MSQKTLILAPIFSDGMVLQRDRENCIYGTETKADWVTISFRNEEYTAKVGGKGDFYIQLPKVSAGGPYTIMVKGSERITISDVLFGDVFLLTGQSNMELPIRRVLDVSAEEVSQTCEPEIRQYLLPAVHKFSGPNKFMFDSAWKKAQDEALMEFSAIGYFFAKEIKEIYKIPVGLVMAAVGGSTIEAWMNPHSVKKFGGYDSLLTDFHDIEYFNEYIRKQQECANQWLEKLEEDEKEIKKQENHKEWNLCTIPSLVTDYQEEPFQGSVYLRREIFLEEEPGEEKSSIYMGTIIDSDRIYLNGTLIGQTEYRYPPRKHEIPKGILKKGSNTILIRIVINNKNGGTVKGRPYYISYNGKKYNLEGEWYYRIGKKADKAMPEPLFPPRLSTGLYHTAIVPLARISFRSILWYQGESNTGSPARYKDKFAEMLTDWRNLFQSKLPCLYVQLPNYQEPLHSTLDSGWAEIREQQRQCLDIEQVEMVVAMDLGEYNDLHPQNKKEVALRLVKAARHLVYHEEENPYPGPIPQKAFRLGEQVIIEFRHLEDSGKEAFISHFELAGKEGNFHPAKAVRKGKCVIVTCNQVDIPTQVRYAWCDNPHPIDFYNGSGLPVAGFCMDLEDV